MGLEPDFPASPSAYSASWEALQTQKHFSLTVFHRILMSFLVSQKKSFPNMLSS